MIIYVYYILGHVVYNPWLFVEPKMFLVRTNKLSCSKTGPFKSAVEYYNLVTLRRMYLSGLYTLHTCILPSSTVHVI